MSRLSKGAKQMRLKIQLLKMTRKSCESISISGEVRKKTNTEITSKSTPEVKTMDNCRSVMQSVCAESIKDIT